MRKKLVNKILSILLLTSLIMTQMSDNVVFAEEAKEETAEDKEVVVIENVEELLSEKYKNLWNDLLYKMSINNFKIVELAKKQVGNVGGERYWKWYGFESRVEWCAIFISWLANQIGVLGTSIPKFSNVGDGIKWYKQRGLWREHNYIAKTGDIIFFDWDNDGKANHVGVVEKVENNMIYTIEGNSNNDRCSEKRYDITSSFILGYGLVL